MSVEGAHQFRRSSTQNASQQTAPEAPTFTRKSTVTLVVCDSKVSFYDPKDCVLKNSFADSLAPKAAVLNLWVQTSLGVASQISCVSVMYVTINNSSKTAFMK